MQSKKKEEKKKEPSPSARLMRQRTLYSPWNAKCTKMTCTRTASQSSSHSMVGAMGHGSSMRLRRGNPASDHSYSCAPSGRCDVYVLLSLS